MHLNACHFHLLLLYCSYMFNIYFCGVAGLSGESRTPARDGSFNKHFGAWKASCEAGHMGGLIGVDQSHCSDSNSSEVSVSESVATNRITNLSIYRESHNWANMLFIDFLGVGAT